MATNISEYEVYYLDSSGVFQTGYKTDSYENPFAFYPAGYAIPLEWVV